MAAIPSQSARVRARRPHANTEHACLDHAAQQRRRQQHQAFQRRRQQHQAFQQQQWYLQQQLLQQQHAQPVMQQLPAHGGMARAGGGAHHGAPAAAWLHRSRKGRGLRSAYRRNICR